MKEVREEVFLHIHKLGRCDEEWEVGKKIVIGEGINPFTKICEGSSAGFCGYRGLEFISHVMDVWSNTSEPSEKLSREVYHPLNAIKHTRGILKEYIFKTREYIFEEVRREGYKDYPSRHRGIWIMEDDRDTLNYWHKQLINKGQPYKIFKVSLSGKIHGASQEYLEVETHSLEVWRELAHSYWQGKSTRNGDEKEYIFEGMVEILEEVQLRDY